MLEHGIELQFVTWAGFVGGQSPGGGIVREIVIFIGGAFARGAGNIQREDKFAFLPGVVQKRRRNHVRRRLLRGLGGCGNANAGGTIGKGDDFLRDDNLLDLLQPILIERKNRVAYKLLFFQLVNHVAVVARRKIAFFRDARGDWLHFALNFCECFMRHGGDLRWWNVDAILLEIQRIFFRRQAEVGSRFRQDVRPHPGVVVGELYFELAERLLPTFQIVFRQERGDSVDVVRIAREFGFDFHARRINDAGFRHLLNGALLQNLDDWRIAGFDAGIFAEACYGRGTAVGRGLFIEQESAGRRIRSCWR